MTISLYVLAALALAGAVISGASPWLWPVQVPTPASAFHAADRPATATQSLPPLSAFEPILDRPLRRPLTGRVSLQPATQPIARALPTTAPIQLIGTAVDSQSSVGIFLTTDGTVEVRGIGQKAGGAEVIEIAQRTAKLKRNGELIVLSMVKPDIASASASTTADPKSRAAEWLSSRNTAAAASKPGMSAKVQLDAQEAALEAEYEAELQAEIDAALAEEMADEAEADDE